MSERTVACACGAEATEEQLLARLEEVLKEYRDRPGALIPVLQIAQGIFGGYLPESALKRISLRLDKSYSEVAGVVSFYSFFSTAPRGKHLVRVCLGTACYVRGGQARARRDEAEARDRRGRDDAGPPVHAGSRALLRRLRPGAGDDD